MYAGESWHCAWDISCVLKLGELAVCLNATSKICRFICCQSHFCKANGKLEIASCRKETCNDALDVHQNNLMWVIGTELKCLFSGNIRNWSCVRTVWQNPWGIVRGAIQRRVSSSCIVFSSRPISVLSCKIAFKLHFRVSPSIPFIICEAEEINISLKYPIRFFSMDVCNEVDSVYWSNFSL